MRFSREFKKNLTNFLLREVRNVANDFLFVNKPIQQKFLHGGKIYKDEKKYYYTIFKEYKKKNRKLAKNLLGAESEMQTKNILKEIRNQHPLWYYAICKIDKLESKTFKQQNLRKKKHA